MRHFRLEYILLYLHRISVFTQNLGQTPVKGKNGKEKPLLHGCVCFHVAAVGAILIQLKFQSDKVEFILEITAMLF